MRAQRNTKQQNNTKPNLLLYFIFLLFKFLSKYLECFPACSKGATKSQPAFGVTAMNLKSHHGIGTGLMWQKESRIHPPLWPCWFCTSWGRFSALPQPQMQWNAALPGCDTQPAASMAIPQTPTGHQELDYIPSMNPSPFQQHCHQSQAVWVLFYCFSLGFHAF